MSVLFQVPPTPAAATLQSAYDASVGGATPEIILDATRGGLTIRDNAVPIAADLFQVQASGGANQFAVQDGEISIGPGSRRLFRAGFSDPDGRMGMEFLADDMTITSAGGELFSAIFTSASRVITLNIPGGGGLGNDTAPSGFNLVHTVRFEDTGFLFAAQLLINAAVRVECATATVGPLYLFLDQYRTYADGVTATCTQHNTIRAQPTWGPNINGGNITQTNATLFLLATTVDATVGTASIITWLGMLIATPNLIAGGTIGAWTGLELQNIAGPTTILGISSAMSNGTFINHTGVAVSAFAGDIHMNNGVPLVLGSVASNRVELLRSAAGVMRMIGVGGTNNEGLDLDFDAAANVVGISSSTGAALRVNNRLDINNGIALGGGAAPTFGTIGGSGPAAAAQAQWLEIDINGVAHWIPVWV